MTIAVCFKCGAMKWGAFNPCEKCGSSPITEDDFALSLAMTDHYFDKAGLQQMGKDIALGKPLHLDEQTRKELIQMIRSVLPTVKKGSNKHKIDETLSISEIITSNLDVYNEIESRDSVFRSDFDAEKRKEISPWIMMGREELNKEEEIIWRKLYKKEISDSEAIEEITNLMEKYYNMPYPLRGHKSKDYDNYDKLRIEICDIIEQMIEHLLTLENMFLEKFSDKNMNNFQNNYNSPDSKLEKALFSLAVVHLLYQKSNIDMKEFHSLTYSVYDLFSSEQIEKKLFNFGFKSKEDFLNKRINFYIDEIIFFNKMKNPHSGKITYFWYQAPLSLKEGFDINMFILGFFSKIVLGEFLSIFINHVKKIIEKYL